MEASCLTMELRFGFRGVHQGKERQFGVSVCDCWICICWVAPWRTIVPKLKAFSDQSELDWEVYHKSNGFMVTTISLIGMMVVMLQAGWEILLLFAQVFVACISIRLGRHSVACVPDGAAYDARFLLCMLLVICFPFKGLAGLAVTYGVSLNSQQLWWVWCLYDVENKIIKVERMQQYTRISLEPVGHQRLSSSSNLAHRRHDHPSKPTGSLQREVAHGTPWSYVHILGGQESRRRGAHRHWKINSNSGSVLYG